MGASGIGKTMIARNRRYAPENDPGSGITSTPLLLLQAPPASDERRFYMHILAAVGAPSSASSLRAQSVASLEVRVSGWTRLFSGSSRCATMASKGALCEASARSRSAARTAIRRRSRAVRTSSSEASADSHARVRHLH